MPLPPAPAKGWGALWYLVDFTDSKMVSHVGLKCQNIHQDNHKILHLQCLEILDLPVHNDIKKNTGGFFSKNVKLF